VLETLALSVIFAVVVATTVCYLHVWTIRLRLRRLEIALAEWEERLVKEVKTRAARASVDARQGRLNPLDEALIRQHTGAPAEDAPWWDQLVGGGGKREQ
jgi:hypothetical protein